MKVQKMYYSLDAVERIKKKWLHFHGLIVLSFFSVGAMEVILIKLTRRVTLDTCCKTNYCTMDFL